MESDQIVVATKFVGTCDEGCCVDISISRPDKEKLTVENLVEAMRASVKAFMEKFRPNEEVQEILANFTKTDTPEHLN